MRRAGHDAWWRACWCCVWVALMTLSGGSARAEGVRVVPYSLDAPSAEAAAGVEARRLVFEVDLAVLSAPPQPGEGAWRLEVVTSWVEAGVVVADGAEAADVTLSAAWGFELRIEGEVQAEARDRMTLELSLSAGERVAKGIAITSPGVAQMVVLPREDGRLWVAIVRPWW